MDVVLKAWHQWKRRKQEVSPEYYSGNPIGENYRRLISRTTHLRMDLIQPLCMLILSITGVLFIYSALAYSGERLWIKQIVWIALGTVVYGVVSLINYKIFLRYAHLIYCGSLICLFLLWTPLGQERGNALRWINLGVFSFQPSEMAKIGVLIIVASLLTRSKIGTVKESFKVLVKIGVVIMLPILLIFMQPDLGSALVFPPMVFSLLYTSKLSKRFFTAVFIAFIVVVGIVSVDLYKYYNFLKINNYSAYENRGEYEPHSFIPLKDYQRNRILAFIAPEKIDPNGNEVSWNLIQSLISVGTGGLVGKGHGEGTQAKLGYLPQSVAHNDFIFSVLAEEKGFLGSLFVIGLYTILVCNNVRIATTARDRFGMLLVIGVSVVFMVHIFVNIGMTIGLMPITGLPLPFLSYGGSFILSCCILQGLVQSVHRYRRDFS